MRCSAHTGIRAKQGFSLVEMMVAMTLGVLILLAVSDIFINNNRTRSEIENTTYQIENGRYAMRLLESEVANAGFFGEAKGQSFPSTLPPPCPSSESNLRDSMGVPVYGENNVASGSQPSCLANYKSSNDYLAIRRSATCTAGSLASDCEELKDGVYYAQVSACKSDNLSSVVLKNSVGSLTAMTRKCDSAIPAPRYRFLSRLYYVNDSDVLVRAELGAAGYVVTPMVDGIERLHFQYGLDTTGNGEIDSFKAAPSGSEWKDVVAVRIWLLARNPSPTPGYTDDRTYVMGDEGAFTPNDHFKRQLYTSTVRLNNVSGRREIP